MNTIAKRRASGEGNIRKRKDGRWEGRYVAGHDENGKPIRKNVLGKTQAEVKVKLKSALVDAQILDVAKADEYTVKSWVLTWYELYSKPNIRETTQEYYWNFIRFHIIPQIGHIKLTKLTARDVQRLYNHVRRHGRQKQDGKGEGMSAAYVRGLHMMLHNCLDRAVREQLILRNPTEDVIVPKLEKKEMKTLQPEDMDAFLREAKRRGVLPMFFLELCTGLRKGELAALLWEDLDIAGKTISVSKSAAREKGGGVKVVKPKTDTSIRKIAIPQEAIDLLIQEHRHHPDNPHMFPSPVTGGMYYPDAISRLNTRILQSAGLEHIRMHDLRHPYVKTATTHFLRNFKEKFCFVSIAVSS